MAGAVVVAVPEAAAAMAVAATEVTVIQWE